MGIESFYTDSNGHHEPNPKFLRKAEYSIKHAQRRIYSKKKGSTCRRKARARYSRKHLRVSRQGNEHAKRLARNVCKSNANLATGEYPRGKVCDLVAYEDLRVSNLLKNHNLAKSIADASWHLFRQWIEYFAAKFGRSAIAVPPHYTSGECSHCGQLVKKSLSTRTHTCQCGCNLHRDINAAINILQGAKSRGGHPQSNATGDGTSTLFGATLIEQVLSMNVESLPL